jgi:AcrR family transcriptional regulator
MARRYRKSRRAESQAGTRLRIVEALVSLHGELGPARTTISDVARRAGVQRLTVYRHFPDERAMFEACTSHWSALHPAPDPARWESVADPQERLRRALGALYAYYRGGDAMFERVFRQLPETPALAAWERRWDAWRTSLLAGLRRGVRASGARGRRVDAALALVTDFWTWRTLSASGLGDAEAAETAAAMVRAVC